MIQFSKYLVLVFIVLLGCKKNGEQASVSELLLNESVGGSGKLIDENGNTIQSRFIPPKGFERKAAARNSFAEYLRNLPLKPAGSKVKYYNGEIKDNGVYDAVVAMEISNKNLQQCADAIIRLRAEYFYSISDYNQISFDLTNGFRMDYSDWMDGNRVLVNGNHTAWQRMAQASNSYRDFREYLEFVFMYAGTLSLSKSLHPKNIKDIAIGDVFIRGGSPGHAVIVVDMAENNKGEKVFLLAQSYMPAQETQILKNPNDPNLSPWYSAGFSGQLQTPEWIFDAAELKTW